MLDLAGGLEEAPARGVDRWGATRSVLLAADAVVVVVGAGRGAAVVGGNAFLAPILGTGLTVMVTQVGMIGGGLLIDQLGLLGAPRRPATALQVMGVLVMVAGVGVIRFG